jgi:hypothetical protein
VSTDLEAWREVDARIYRILRHYSLPTHKERRGARNTQHFAPEWFCLVLHAWYGEGWWNIMHLQSRHAPIARRIAREPEFREAIQCSIEGGFLETFLTQQKT